MADSFGVYVESPLDVICPTCGAPRGYDCGTSPIIRGQSQFPHRMRQAHAELFHYLIDQARERKPFWPRNRELLAFARGGSP